MNFKWYSFFDEGVQDGFNIRLNVFCDEVGFSKDFEFDENDKKSLHLVCYDNNTPVCNARLFLESPGTAHFGRLRRKKEFRGKGYGKATLKAAIEKCKELGISNMILGAKYDMKDFYLLQDFEIFGDIFYEQNIPHVMMKKEIDITDGFAWYDAEDKRVKDSFILRKKVFCDEIGFSEKAAFDEKDKTATHLVYYKNGQVVCCVRVNKIDDDTWFFGRLCVDKSIRGKGFGKFIVDEISSQAKNFDIKNLIVAAKYDKKDFYKAMGFSSYGNIIYEENIPHIMMEKHII